MTVTHAEPFAAAIVRRLPAPRVSGGLSLAEALFERRSHREFSASEVDLDSLAQLCWAAQGISDSSEGLRTTPSAGAVFPLSLLVAEPGGVSRYDPAAHSLTTLFDGDVRPAMQAASLDQSCVGTAPVCLVLTMDVRAMHEKYGRGARVYCLLEVGHAAQNVLLEATALDLVGVPVAAFSQARVSKILRLPACETPVYLLPVGHRV